MHRQTGPSDDVPTQFHSREEMMKPRPVTRPPPPLPPVAAPRLAAPPPPARPSLASSPLLGLQPLQPVPTVAPPPALSSAAPRAGARDATLVIELPLTEVDDKELAQLTAWLEGRAARVSLRRDKPTLDTRLARARAQLAVVAEAALAFVGPLGARLRAALAPKAPPALPTAAKSATDPRLS
jgi:hypothetical protein